MGIYDRDYYRKEGPSYLDAFSLRGQATKWIIIVTIVVFILQIITRVQHRPGDWGPGIITATLCLNPTEVLHGEVWRLVTYAFLHDEHNVWHIVINLWLLWMFGGYVEEIYGRWEFLAFYLTAALMGGLAFLGEQTAGWGRPALTIGASGAVTAVTILCAFYHPRLTILLFFVLPVPIWVLAVFQVVNDVFGFLGGSGQGVAFSVHLGGAAFAALYFKSKFRILGVWDWLRSWKIGRGRPRLRLYRPEEDRRQPVAVASVVEPIDEQLEARSTPYSRKSPATAKTA